MLRLANPRSVSRAVYWAILPVCVGALLGPARRLGAEEAAGQYAKTVGNEPSLVSYWRMEGNCQDAKGVANGEVRGGEVQYAEGPGGGKAISLANGRFVTMGTAPKLDLPQTTLELWFRPDAPAGSTAYNPCIIAKRGNPPHNNTRFSIHALGDYQQLAFWNGRQVMQFTPPGGPFQQGRWYYLAVTCDAKETKMYLDGVPCEAAEGPCVFSVAVKDLPLQVGSSTPQGQELFACSIDEVAIYSKALSEADVARHVDAMGWKEKREKLAKAGKERGEKEKALAAEREAERIRRLAELMSADSLFARGEPRVCRGQNLTGISMPTGGIAAGPIQMDGKGTRAIWQIFNNYAAAAVPNSFFAVRAKAGDEKPVVRALQTVPAGAFEGMKELTFRGQYPFGWFSFQDDQVPVQVSMEVFSPLVPLDARNSAIPCVVYNLTAENTGQKVVDVSFLASQQNAVGYAGGAITNRSCAGYGQNSNRLVREEGSAILHMTAKQEKATPGSGDMALAVLGGDISATASWKENDKLAEAFENGGSVSGPEEAGPSPAGETVDGALAASFKLQPGQKKTVTFILAWYFPNARQPWCGQGNMYANWWPDALGVARDVAKRVAELSALTHRYNQTLYASNLPYWMLDRISSQVAILASKTCFWTKEGYFGGWEGCNPRGGCCNGNCGHVWHYAQAHARLFPEIARAMREEALRYQRADGAIFFRQPNTGIASDAQSGEVLEAYREYTQSPDRKWLDQNWPKIKKTMEFHIRTWDADEDGVLSGSQHNTLDADTSGSTSWLGSMYLAALTAAGKMARMEGDAEAAARYDKIRQSGMKKQNETLWNGEYYFQIPGPAPLRDYNNGCHIDQVLGQWWAHQLDLGWVYPPDRVRTALASLVKYNFRTDFHGVPQSPRKFVADEDMGLQMIQWPRKDRPANHMLYADEVMTGFEYAAAATMIQAGLLKEGFTTVKAISDRYDGRLRTGLSGGDCTSWGYSGNPFGDDECGKYYARAMSSWSLLLACQGFIYDGPAGVIGFKPAWRPDDHVSMFTASEGYGLFTQKRGDGKQTDRIEVKCGRLNVKTLVFEIPAEAKVSGIAVRVAGKEAKSTHALNDGRLTITLESPAAVGEGEALEATIAL